MTTTKHRKAYRKSYDSTTTADTPMNGDLYLAYKDGAYANVAPMKRRHKGKTVVGITVTGHDLDAQMADVEAGDLSPIGGAKWAAAKKRRGEIGTLYFPASSLSVVRAACREAGLKPGHDVLFFAAQYDGKPKIPRWAVGKQYLHGDAGHPGTYSGGHFDTSVVRRYWPGVDPLIAIPLSKGTVRRAGKLAAQLRKRNHPVGAGLHTLVSLDHQLHRIFDIRKG